MKLYHNTDTFMGEPGPHKGIINTDNIINDCTHIRGNAQNLTGDVSGLNGDITGLSGNATNCYSPWSDLYIGDVTLINLHMPTAEVL
tara:strand:- start:102 stop:362 length:261 start_codon:yes stop_codon:yes gene_type:complete